MMSVRLNFLSLLVATSGVLVGLVVGGCDAPLGGFPSNDVHALALSYSRDVPTARAQADVKLVVDELFGTPDQPAWPDRWADKNLKIDPANLSQAAGPQLSEQDGTHRGLYREHCVKCHGLAGSGAGPASLFQNPYPRDFRAGVFKWKSTQRSAKPTRQDLLNLLHRGVPGTGMPTFELVDPSELEALTDYLIYLSVRGEVERQLMAVAIDELGYGEDELEDDAKLATQGESDGATAVADVIGKVTASWVVDANDAVPVPEFAELTGDALTASIERGHELFHGQIANCFACHGRDGGGEATTLDYDDWTKAYSTRLGLTPTDRDSMRPFKKAGALTPRVAKPRRLTSGVFHGGGDTETLYRRITQGIAGTPMPSLRVVPTADGTGLTVSQIEDLIRYVRSLGSGSDSP